MTKPASLCDIIDVGNRISENYGSKVLLSGGGARAHGLKERSMRVYQALCTLLVAAAFWGFLGEDARAAIPNRPTGLTVTAVSANRVALSWRDNSGDEDGFRIRRIHLDGPTDTLEVGRDQTAYNDTGLEPDTKYFYSVWAFNSDGGSQLSNRVEVTTSSKPPGPDAPEKLTANGVSPGQIDLEWQDNSANEDGFRIWRSLDGVSFTDSADVGGNQTAYSDIGLQPNTTYYYQVAAFNSNGQSLFSNRVEVTTPAELSKPDAPSDLTANGVSPSQIELRWQDNSANEDGFRIWRSADGISFSHLADVGRNQTTYSDTGLQPDTKYFYSVWAFNSAGVSALSNRVEVTTPAAPSKPDAPGSLTANGVSSSQIELRWQDNSANEDGFRIWRSVDGVSFADSVDVGRDQTTYTDTGLQPGTNYHYRVAAFNGEGVSALSNRVEVATSAAPSSPDAPGNLTASVISPSQIELRWQDNSANEDGFRIWRSLDGVSFADSVDVGRDQAIYSDTGLQPGVTYFYQVAGFNGEGVSALSNRVEATTFQGLASPSELTARAVSFSRVDLSWQDNSNNEDGFRIRRIRLDGSSLFTDTLGVARNETAYSDTSLQPGTKYLYSVWAFNSEGESPLSNPAEVTTPPKPSKPGAPVNLAATAVCSDRIELRWRDNSNNEDGFWILRSLDGASFTDSIQVGSNETAYGDTSLKLDTEYTYQVVAFNDEGESPSSNRAEATTSPVPPSDLAAWPGTYNPIGSADYKFQDNSDYNTVDTFLGVLETTNFVTRLKTTPI